jgi:hypothetical protein
MYDIKSHLKYVVLVNVKWVWRVAFSETICNVKVRILLYWFNLVIKKEKIYRTLANEFRYLKTVQSQREEYRSWDAWDFSLMIAWGVEPTYLDVPEFVAPFLFPGQILWNLSRKF